ncbi:MAG: glutamine--tRNA ligase/YqeY domain fusion protein [Symbiobacteriaceae bacterium]|nr:glutamine--tRNA ligase/YqeY domain fusion protein [Symbiobacteriaceae bacterium]
MNESIWNRLTAEPSQERTGSHFIRDIVIEDIAAQKNGGFVHTRYPPEPNGYLHIGHLKAIYVDYGLAVEFNGTCNLRFDDTNPEGESMEYVEALIADSHWLGCSWGDRIFYASDYFEMLYEFTQDLIRDGKAYVDDLSVEETRLYRGTLTEPGRNSPWRDRSIEESLDLFARMRAGEFPEGARTVRAKINMSAGNINMRDPVLYRILKADHYRTGDTWCIYPMYDYQHPISDAIEGITHSCCSLEYADHNELYRWFVDNVRWQHRSLQPENPIIPSQYEFSRLNITYVIMSKRKLKRLVTEGYVSGWDDPRMPTISGLRRRGYTAASLMDFVTRAGVARSPTLVDIALLEHCIREELNLSAPRVMSVLKPLKVILTNYPDGQFEEVEVENNPEDPNAGVRMVKFGQELYIEQDDFMEVPVKGFHRLCPGGEIRLKGAYIIRCDAVVKNDSGEITELLCSYDPETKSGATAGSRKVKGTSHWVEASSAIDATVRLYDKLFTIPDPEADAEEGVDFVAHLNPDSLDLLTGCKMEPFLANAPAEMRYQFMRQGYFYVDHVDHALGNLVFNRIVSLKDAWVREQRR